MDPRIFLPHISCISSRHYWSVSLSSPQYIVSWFNDYYPEFLLHGIVDVFPMHYTTFGSTVHPSHN